MEKQRVKVQKGGLEKEVSVEEQRQIGVIRAVVRGGKGSNRRKVFTDICSNSGRHKRA